MVTGPFMGFLLIANLHDLLIPFKLFSGALMTISPDRSFDHGIRKGFDRVMLNFLGVADSTCGILLVP